MLYNRFYFVSSSKLMNICVNVSFCVMPSCISASLQHKEFSTPWRIWPFDFQLHWVHHRDYAPLSLEMRGETARLHCKGWAACTWTKQHNYDLEFDISGRISVHTSVAISTRDETIQGVNSVALTCCLRRLILSSFTMQPCFIGGTS